MTTPPRRIDHLVLAVHDLEDAADFYTRMGFQVGARNRHPWGTENRLIQFGSSFLELITVADAEQVPPHAHGFFGFGAFVEDYLTKREGLAMFALDSCDAAADAAQFAREGIAEFQPFSFERTGRQPDGTPTRVAFSLAFACDDRLPDTAFFVCQHHHPEAFWNPLLQRHPNRANVTAAVTLDVETPKAHAGFLRAFTGAPPSEDGRHYPLGNGGQLAIQTRRAAPGFTGFSIGVADLDLVAQRLTAGHVPFQKHPGRLSIDADHCFGTRIDFTTGRVAVRDCDDSLTNRESLQAGHRAVNPGLVPHPDLRASLVGVASRERPYSRSSRERPTAQNPTPGQRARPASRTA